MNKFEEYIDNYFNSLEVNTITRAMKYSMSGGKRIRPRIIFALAKDLGIDEETCYPCALALEMIQTYSLIHDDLPEMDNDDYRRGKLTCHKQFGTGIALLAGDSLLNHGFGVIADSDYEPEIKVKMISCLSKYAGLQGMIKGQLLDVEGVDEENEFNLKLIHDNKTGGLFKISCLFPMFLASLDKEEYFCNLGSKIGIIFQNQDDLFDEIRTIEETGKSLSDKDNDKFTAVKLYGVEELKIRLSRDFLDLYEYLDVDFLKGSNIKDLMLQMENR